jgi:hypothetical protein
MKIFFCITLLFSTVLVKGQSWDYRFAASDAIIYQKEFVDEVTPLIVADNKKINIGVGPTILFTERHNTVYFNLGCNAEIDNKKLYCYLTFAHRKMLGVYNNNLTPEIGIYIGSHYIISLGYNIALTNKLYLWTSGIRIALRVISS